MSDFDDFTSQLDALETSMSRATGVAANFDAELRGISQSFSNTQKGLKTLETSVTRGLGKAIDGIVLDGMKLSDALRSIATSVVDAAYSAAVKPITSQLGGLLTQGVGAVFGGAFADGAAFSQGRVMPFAKGGVITGPTTFPMKGATGLMGEAGPEAIMPLTRGPDGSLGVKAQSGGQGPVTIVMNISTPDVQGFQRSQTQIAAQMSRALSRGARNR